jgi:hypothetical protein
MDHANIESPSVAAEQTDEALRLALGRAVMALLRVANVRGMTPAAAAERLDAVAEIFERQAAHHDDK